MIETKIRSLRLGGGGVHNIKKPVLARPPLPFRPFGCGPIVPGLPTAIEAAKGAARINERDTTMATIGSFTSSNGNGFTGTIRTLALNVKAQIRRIDNPSDRGPQFRVFAQGGVDYAESVIMRSVGR